MNDGQQRVHQGDEIRHDWPDGRTTWHLVRRVAHYPDGSALAVCDQHEETLDYGATLCADRVRPAHTLIDRALSEIFRDPDEAAEEEGGR